ncbi:MAG: prepilin peptidase [Clostridiales bacterium]|nr:prepilin peptidase [Clostridiales bacterium]
MWMIVFVCFLLAASGQDLCKKCVDIRIYQIFALLSVLLALGRQLMLGETYHVLEHVTGMSLGVGLLGLGMLSGGIGSGDGYFFLVSGMMLGFRENLTLLCAGILLCGLFCMGYLIWGLVRKGINVRKCSVPFLPFVVIPGLWMAVEGIL